MATILLAHADTDDREMYAEYLRFAGYDVLGASTTDEAVMALPSCDVLVTGLMVPGVVDAFDLIAGASQGRWGRTIPVVVVTACIVPTLHQQAADAGARPVLLKPCFPCELRAVIEQRLRDLHPDSATA